MAWQIDSDGLMAIRCMQLLHYIRKTCNTLRPGVREILFVSNSSRLAITLGAAEIEIVFERRGVCAIKFWPCNAPLMWGFSLQLLCLPSCGARMLSQVAVLCRRDFIGVRPSFAIHFTE